MTRLQQDGRRLAFPGVVLLAVLAGIPRPATAQTCINDITDQTNRCTADDVRIVALSVAPDGVIDGCDFPGDTATANLRAEVVSGAKLRYDIGLWVALDGGDARTGSCLHDFLGPAVTATESDVDNINGAGPYLDADGDACGDLPQGVHTFRDLGPVTVACVDVDSDGCLDVSTFVSWRQNAQDNCAGVADTLPGTVSKCRQDLTVNCLPIPVPPTTSTTIETTTTTSPSTTSSTQSSTTTSSTGSTTSTTLCLPPPETACSNMRDDDCDRLFDCNDPDCNGVAPCPRIKRDPTMIRFGLDGMPDRLRSSGKVAVSPVDVMQVQVGWLLTNTQGVLYQATLEPGDLTPSPDGRVFRFYDPEARFGTGRRAGIFTARLKPLHDGSGYSYSLEAYGDLSAATDPAMALQFYVGDRSVFIMHGLWTQTPRGWRAPKDH